MLDILLGVALVGGILGVAFYLTRYAAKNYRSCPSCRTLNAHRREKCRSCGTSLVDEGSGSP